MMKMKMSKAKKRTTNLRVAKDKRKLKKAYYQMMKKTKT